MPTDRLIPIPDGPTITQLGPPPLTPQQIADAVCNGLLDAFREIGRALSLTDDERNALEIHRLKRVALRRAAQAHVAKTAGIVERQTYNVTR